MKATRGYIDAVAGGLSLETGVTLTAGTGWFTDIESKTVTYVTRDLLDRDISLIKGLLLHEIAHVNHTGSVKQQETTLQKKYPQAMQEVYNAFEDVRIDKKNVTQYGDFAAQANEGVTLIAAEGVNHMPQKALDSLNSLQRILGATMYDEAKAQAYSYYGEMAAQKVRNRFLRSMTGDERSAYEVVTRFRDKARACSDVNTLKELIDREVYPHLKDYITEAEKQEQAARKAGKELGKALTKHMLKKHKDHDNPTPSRTEEAPEAPLLSLPTRTESEGLLAPYINTLSRKFNEILTHNKATRVTGNRLTGSLISKNAYKVLTGEERIFSRKETPNVPDYVVTIVLDESGSMASYNRFEYTYLTAVMLEEICKRLKLTTNIIIYDGQVRRAETVEEYRAFHGGDNNDADAMKEVLKTTHAHNKNLVFVLTDGGVEQDPRPYIAEIKKRGYTFVSIGVGLSGVMLDKLREYYGHSVEAANVEALPAIMVRELKRVIRRRQA